MNSLLDMAGRQSLWSMRKKSLGHEGDSREVMGGSDDKNGGQALTLEGLGYMMEMLGHQMKMVDLSVMVYV